MTRSQQLASRAGMHGDASDAPVALTESQEAAPGHESSKSKRIASITASQQTIHIRVDESRGPKGTAKTFGQFTFDRTLEDIQ